MAQARPKSSIRQAILEVAQRRFAARGFEATSVGEIAAEVGIRKSSLLYHFGSKEALRRAVLAEILGHWNRSLPAILRAASSGEGEFEAVLGELVGFFADDADRARLLLRELLDRPESVRSLLRTHVAPWIEVVAARLRTAQTRGEAHADLDPEAYSLHVISMVLAGAATHECTQLVSDERHRRELIRIARTSLFVSPRETAARR